MQVRIGSPMASALVVGPVGTGRSRVGHGIPVALGRPLLGRARLGLGLDLGRLGLRRDRLGVALGTGVALGGDRGLGLDALGDRGLPVLGRQRRAALGRLPDLLAGLGVDHPLALGPLLLGVGLLLGELALALDVDAPAGQPGGEAGVLALLPDRQRQLVVGHDDL